MHREFATHSVLCSLVGCMTDCNVVYTLSSSDGSDAVAGTNVTFSGAGDRTLTLSGVSAEVGSTRTDSLIVTIS